MLGETAETVEEWIELYRTQRKIAEMLVRDPTVYVQAWSHAGFSIECLIKAAIMSQQRLNRWPSRKERKDLYVHTIQELLALLGDKIDPLDPAAPAWAIMFRWERSHTYVAKMPRLVAEDCLESAFSSDGVAQWLFTKYLKNYS